VKAPCKAKDKKNNQLARGQKNPRFQPAYVTASFADATLDYACPATSSISDDQMASDARFPPAAPLYAARGQRRKRAGDRRCGDCEGGREGERQESNRRKNENGEEKDYVHRPCEVTVIAPGDRLSLRFFRHFHADTQQLHPKKLRTV